MKCKYCFAELEDGVTLCPVCGKELTEEKTAEKAVAEEIEETEEIVEEEEEYEEYEDDEDDEEYEDDEDYEDDDDEYEEIVIRRKKKKKQFPKPLAITLAAVGNGTEVQQHQRIAGLYRSGYRLQERLHRLR